MADTSLTPGQSSGAASDNVHSITLNNVAEAQHLFQLASQRLLDVNHWHDITGKGSAVFQLTDASGKTVERPARLGDLFSIDIPGPDNTSGDGNDWVRVEAIEETHEPDVELIAMRVRPCPNPKSEEPAVAHFLDSDATSTFSVIRNGNKVTASVNGRNEKPNTDTNSLVGKLRNLLVGGGAMAGLNKPQWKRLVHALINN